MQKRPKRKVRLEYRQYNLNPDYPVKALLRGHFIFPQAQYGGISYMHLHNCVELGYNYKGSNTLLVEEEEERVAASGDVTVVCPFAMHASYQTGEQCRVENEWEYVYVDPVQLFHDFYPGGFPGQELFAHHSPNFPSVISHEDYPQLTVLVRDILEEMRRKEPRYQELVKAKLLAFFLEFSRIVSVKASPDLKYNQILTVSPAITYINDHFHEPISAQNLAELCHMSQTHFRRIFKTTMGATPVEYIMGVRMRNSCRLLYETELPILEIAMQVGYNSISSFNRNFFGIMNTTPSKWRNDTRKIHKKGLVFSTYEDPFPGEET